MHWRACSSVMPTCLVETRSNLHANRAFLPNEAVLRAARVKKSILLSFDVCYSLPLNVTDWLRCHLGLLQNVSVCLDWICSFLFENSRGRLAYDGQSSRNPKCEANCGHRVAPNRRPLNFHNARQPACSFTYGYRLPSVWRLSAPL